MRLMPQPSAPPPLDLLASLKKPLQWAFVAGLLTALVTIFMPNYYKSEARLLPVESKSLGGNLGGFASAAAAFGVNLPGSDGNDTNYVDIINSRGLREQLLASEFQFHQKTWRFGDARSQTTTLSKYLDEINTDRALRELAKFFAASRDMKSKVITISAETKSPELSRLLVSRASQLLEQFLLEKGRTRGGAKASFAEARLLEARKEMREAEETLRRFLEVNRNYVGSGDPGVRLKGAGLETELRLRQQLVSAIAMNREQALLEEKNDVPILNVLDAANLPIEKSRPARTPIVILAFVLTVIGSLLVDNWAKLLRQFSQDVDEPSQD